MSHFTHMKTRIFKIYYYLEKALNKLNIVYKEKSDLLKIHM